MSRATPTEVFVLPWPSRVYHARRDCTTLKRSDRPVIPRLLTDATSQRLYVGQRHPCKRCAGRLA